MKSVKKLLVLLIVLQMLLPYPICAAPVAELSSIRGTVKKMRDGVTYVAMANTPLNANDLISTESRSTATIVFANGNVVILEPHSKTLLSEYSAAQRSQRIDLFSGKILAKVKNDPTWKFQVHTPTAVAEVKGTVFSVAYSLTDRIPATTVTCIDGSVLVDYVPASGADSPVPAAIVAAGKTATITSNGVNIAEATASEIAAAAAAKAGVAAGTTAKAGLSTGTITIGAVVAAAVIGGIAIGAGGGGGDNATASHH